MCFIGTLPGSFGKQPYAGMLAPQIIAFVGSGGCLEIPPELPHEVRKIFELCILVALDRSPSIFWCAAILVRRIKFLLKKLQSKV